MQQPANIKNKPLFTSTASNGRHIMMLILVTEYIRVSGNERTSMTTHSVLFSLISEIIQAYSNYKSKSMGQQSIITSLLLFAGSVARIFTSFQETGDPTIILMYMLSTVANGIILYQFLIYNKIKTETVTDKKTQ